ncbi:MAG: hypothetical protein ACREHV_08980 [Rhizomicrobium sp.]
MLALLAGAEPAWAQSAPNIALQRIIDEASTSRAPGSPRESFDFSAAVHLPPSARQPASPMISASGPDEWHRPLTLPGISLAPPQPEFGPVAGKRTRFSGIRLDGVTLFGANVGGSVDGRSAHFTLTWPTAQ